MIEFPTSPCGSERNARAWPVYPLPDEDPVDEPQPERPAPAPLALPALEVPGAKKDDELLSDCVDGPDCDGR